MAGWEGFEPLPRVEMSPAIPIFLILKASAMIESASIKPKNTWRANIQRLRVGDRDGGFKQC
jgi:hypothetical protein